MPSRHDLRRRVLILTGLPLIALIAAGVQAEVRLPGLFSDHMVFQQRKPVPVWGWADPGEPVAVTFRGKTVRTTAQGGKWKVTLPAQKAGGPDVLTVQGKNRIEVQDVLIGEVWIASGQSNMEWPLNRSYEAEADIQNSANPQIRLFTVPKLKSPEPVDDV